MKHPLLSPASDILNQVASPLTVTAVGDDITQDLIDEMLTLAAGEQGSKERPTMVGLAAPQIGVSQRIIIVAVDADGLGQATDFRVYINPEIIEQSIETAFNREGCYSTSHVCGRLARASSVQVKALDRNGKTVQESHTGIPARIFQHEIDHLDGIRFPDRITNDDDLLWVDPEHFGDFRKLWATWPHTCPRAKWEAIKTGRDGA